MPIQVTNGTAFILDGFEREQLTRAAVAGVLAAEAYMAAHPEEAKEIISDAAEAALPKRQRYPEIEPVKTLDEIFPGGAGDAVQLRVEMLALLAAVGR